MEKAEVERGFIELEASKSGFVSKYCNQLHKQLQLEIYEREIIYRIKVLSNNKQLLVL